MFAHYLKSPLSRRVVTETAARNGRVQCLSSMGSGGNNNGGNNGRVRSYPQYTIYGEDCMLSVKVLLPNFRILRSNTLVLEKNKKGRILLEWTPRTSDGTLKNLDRRSETYSVFTQTIAALTPSTHLLTHEPYIHLIFHTQAALIATASSDSGYPQKKSV